MTKPMLYIRRKDTNEIAEALDVEGYSQRDIERMIRGMSINLNHDDYYVDDQS